MPKPKEQNDHDEQEDLLAWARDPVPLELPPEALEKMQQLIDNPPQPSERLRAAAKRQWGR